MGGARAIQGATTPLPRAGRSASVVMRLVSDLSQGERACISSHRPGVFRCSSKSTWHCASCARRHWRCKPLAPASGKLRRIFTPRPGPLTARRAVVRGADPAGAIDRPVRRPHRRRHTASDRLTRPGGDRRGRALRMQRGSRRPAHATPPREGRLQIGMADFTSKSPAARGRCPAAPTGQSGARGRRPGAARRVR